MAKTQANHWFQNHCFWNSSFWPESHTLENKQGQRSSMPKRPKLKHNAKKMEIMTHFVQLHSSNWSTPMLRETASVQRWWAVTTSHNVHLTNFCHCCVMVQSQSVSFLLTAETNLMSWLTTTINKKVEHLFNLIMTEQQVTCKGQDKIGDKNTVASSSPHQHIIRCWCHRSIVKCWKWHWRTERELTDQHWSHWCQNDKHHNTFITVVCNWLINHTCRRTRSLFSQMVCPKCAHCAPAS